MWDPQLCFFPRLLAFQDSLSHHIKFGMDFSISAKNAVGILKGTVLNKITKLFYKVTVPLYIPTSSECKFQIFHILANSWYGHSFILAILVGVQCYLVPFTCISPVTNDEHLRCTYLLSTYLLWWSICLNLLPIFWVICFLIIEFQVFMCILGPSLFWVICIENISPILWLFFPFL